MDPRWDKESIALERASDRLNRHRLAVRQLPAARYRLTANDKTVAEVGREDLEKGLDLLDYAAFPTNAVSQEVLSLVQKRQQMLYAAWRKSIAPAKASEGSSRDTLVEDTERKVAEIKNKIRELCRPKEIEIRLTPL